ncbi:MAG: hypothetical protein H7235_04230 [Bdellovibrionaceae bacterium]|nr:hypothetical protein [Pseudobdellovibrionaceae bacterium]
MLTLHQFEQSYQKLIGHFTEGVYQEELMIAKKEFFSNTGTLDENKPNYALRMRQFFDWYFLTRRLSSHMQTPLEVALEQRNLRLNPEYTEALKILSKSQHSLYEFIKEKNDYFIVRDFFTNKKVEVLSEGQIFNFDDKESFEARLVELNGKNYFLKGFCFHPQSAQKYILDEVKTYKKNPDLDFEEFLIRLNKMRYKLEQYRHIKPEMIYTNENKLKL